MCVVFNNIKYICMCVCVITIRAKGWIMYGMDSKLKLEDQLKNLRKI